MTQLQDLNITYVHSLLDCLSEKPQMALSYHERHTLFFFRTAVSAEDPSVLVDRLGDVVSLCTCFSCLSQVMHFQLLLFHISMNRCYSRKQTGIAIQQYLIVCSNSVLLKVFKQSLLHYSRLFLFKSFSTRKYLCFSMNLHENQKD